MKLRRKDYLRAIYEIYIGRPARNAKKELIYKVELGGKDGFEINGIEGYWGRYGSIDKIVDLAMSLENADQDFEFYYPAKEYDRKYSHRVSVIGTSEDGIVELEYLEASAQCGAYYKKLPIDLLKKEIQGFDDIAAKPQEHGYDYREF